MRALTHPLTIACLAIWILNDHILKAALHNGFTGKLSDVVSLIVFPLLPLAAFDLLRDRAPSLLTHRRREVWRYSWIVATGFVMVTINVFPVAAEAYRVGLAALQYPFVALVSDDWPALHRVDLTMDPSDALTIVALIVPAWLGRERAESLPALPRAARV